MTTFLALKQELRAEIWPAGQEAKTLRIGHDKAFIEAMIDLQKWVPCLQQNNTSQFPMCSAYWENTKTVVDAPNGIITRVYTIANDEWRNKVHYFSGTFHEIECWARKLYRGKTPVNTGLQVLPMGFKFAENSTDILTDGTIAIGRARVGIWAIYRHRLYVAPWLQSNETLVVEWDGVKSDWIDTDGLNSDLWTNDVKEAIKLFAMWKHEVYYGTDRARMNDLRIDYENKRAELVWTCRERTRQQESQECCDTRLPTRAEVAAEVIPTETTEFVVATIGDFGVLGTPYDDVSAAIIALNPQKILSLGDALGYGAVYPNSPTVAELFDRFIGLDVKAAIGNHDYLYQADLSAMLAYLISNFGINNNGRFFTVVVGPVQFFFLSSDPSDPDLGYVDANTPISSSGVQWTWLSAFASLSTARWRIAVFHHPAYTSDVSHGPGAAWMRKDFSALGIDLILNGHGHQYERLVDPNSTPIIINGAGGQGLRAFGAISPQSQVRYNADFGYGKITATCSTLKHEFITRTGVIVDTVTLTK